MNLSIAGMLFFVYSALCVAQSQGYSFTGNDLLKKCNGPYVNETEKIASTNFCQGYLQGLQQMHQVVADVRRVARLYCEPTKTGNYDQLQRVVVKWLLNNPEQLHREARVAATAALIQAFPCSKS